MNRIASIMVEYFHHEVLSRFKHRLNDLKHSKESYEIIKDLDRGCSKQDYYLAIHRLNKRLHYLESEYAKESYGELCRMQEGNNPILNGEEIEELKKEFDSLI